METLNNITISLRGLKNTVKISKDKRHYLETIFIALFMLSEKELKQVYLEIFKNKKQSNDAEEN